MFKIEVQNYYKRCGIREKGNDFYNKLLKIIPPNTKDIRFDFKGVTFVSTSFLDESIFKLLKKYNVSILVRKTGVEKKAKRYSEWFGIKMDYNESSGIINF